MDSSPYQLLVIDDTTHSLLLVDSPNGEIIAEIPYPLEYTPLNYYCHLTKKKYTYLQLES